MGGDWTGQQTMMQKVVDNTPDIIVNMPQDNPKVMWIALLTTVVTSIVAPIVTWYITKRKS